MANANETRMPSEAEDDEARIQQMTDRAAAVSSPDTQKGLPGFSPIPWRTGPKSFSPPSRRGRGIVAL
jgi:hypothetical protein